MIEEPCRMYRRGYRDEGSKSSNELRNQADMSLSVAEPETHDTRVASSKLIDIVRSYLRRWYLPKLVKIIFNRD